MASRERVAAAMRHAPPDRVPVMCQLAPGHDFLHSGRPPAEIWFDSETFARTLVEFQRAYGFDGLLVNLWGRPPGWRRDLVAERPTDEGRELRWSNGLVTRLPPDDNPHTFAPDGGALPGSGYILASACSVAPRVAPGRLRAMVALAERYGRY